MARSTGSTLRVFNGALLALVLSLAVAKCYASPTVSASADDALGFGAEGKRGGSSSSESVNNEAQRAAEAVAAAEQFRLMILAELDQQQQQQQQLMQSAEHETFGGRAAAPRHRGPSAARRRKPNAASAPATGFAVAPEATAPDHADSSAWAADDAASSDLHAVVRLHSERGPLRSQDRETSLVFGLKPADRDLRVDSAILTFHLADGVLPLTGSSRREHRRPTIKVELVHWEKYNETYKTEPVDGTLKRMTDSRYSYDIEGDRLRGILERTGRLEMLVRCTNCIADRRGHRAAASSGTHGGTAAPVAVGAADLVLYGRRPRHRLAVAAAATAAEEAAAGPAAVAAAEGGSCDSKCCLRKLEVDFDQLGEAYSWVVSPRRFTANYCAGSCSDGEVAADLGGNCRNRTAQAIVVDLMLQKQGKSLGSCCVASATTPVHIIYMDLNGVFHPNSAQLYTTTACACS